MHNAYQDIRTLTTEEPQWWDERAVPRYCAFSPQHIANIYAEEAVLMLVTCQGCGREFRVAMSQDVLERHGGRTIAPGDPISMALDAVDADAHRGSTLAELISKRELHYGDPPNSDCCASGPTMNSEPRRVIEYWSSRRGNTWVRDPELEIDITPDWVDAEFGP